MKYLVVFTCFLKRFQWQYGQQHLTDMEICTYTILSHVLLFLGLELSVVVEGVVLSSAHTSVVFPCSSILGWLRALFSKAPLAVACQCFIQTFWQRGQSKVLGMWGRHFSFDQCIFSNPKGGHLESKGRQMPPQMKPCLCIWYAMQHICADVLTPVV